MTDKPMTAADVEKAAIDMRKVLPQTVEYIEEQAVADYLASDAFTDALARGLQGKGCLATYFGGNGCTCRECAAAIAAAMRGEQE